MSAEPHLSPGLGDLEKELTCSICTDLLYQPLTLLDCLHTFCGSCLKEWFSAQASRARSSVRFTCPSCRAVVRETRPNATVTTLLDMVLAASPDRDKSAEEKEEIAQKYKHGDSVFPTLPSSERSAAASDEEDRRLLEEVRELSLQESRARTRATGHRSRQSSRTRRTESTDVDGSRRRREEERAARRRPGDNVSERTRRIEHQSSLRSLLSLSDTEAIQEEILRQILEEGLLDDIDMDNLGPAQEEELSERIADAYRRRHRLRARSQQRLEAPETRQASSRSRARSQSVQRPQEASTQNDSSRNPPVSRPYLLDPLVSRNGASGHQRRLSEQGSSQRRTSPVRANPASSSEVTLRPATRSSSDVVAERPRNSQAARVRNDSSTPRSRRATASEQNVPNIWVEGTRERAIRRPGRLSIDSPRVVASPEQSTRTGSWPASPGVPTPATAPATSSLAAEVGSGREPRSRPSSSRSNAPRSTTYREPSISCDQCGKPDIQYDLHKRCPKCNDGKYHLCARCYRIGRGCPNWAGFRASAEASFERIIASSSGHSQPVSDSQQHILQSCQYRRAPDTAYRSDSNGRTVTTDDPSHRMTTGFFCDSCQSPANDCYWKCNQCNEGDWGFCNRCVNQGRCCTHALLPICRMTRSPSSSPSPTATNNSPSRSPETYKILSIATNCDICANPIPDSTPRFHCLQCNDGDYDICTNCYLRLVAIGKIRKENGHNGWRRCLKGHRMIVSGFEEHEDGQRRVIVRDLVGGRALNDDHLQPSPAATPVTAHFSPNHNVASPEVGSGDWSWKEGAERRKKASRMRPWTIGDRDRASEPSTPIASPSPFSLSTPALSSQNASSTTRRYPPDGGVGLIVHALWSWYPEDGVKDELMFPRGAEITEAENINDDWYWGCYAGLTGLFPGAHIFVAGEVA